MHAPPHSLSTIQSEYKLSAPPHTEQEAGVQMCTVTATVNIAYVQQVTFSLYVWISVKSTTDV